MEFFVEWFGYSCPASKGWSKANLAVTAFTCLRDARDARVVAGAWRCPLRRRDETCSPVILAALVVPRTPHRPSGWSPVRLILP